MIDNLLSNPHQFKTKRAFFRFSRESIMQNWEEYAWQTFEMDYKSVSDFSENFAKTPKN